MLPDLRYYVAALKQAALAQGLFLDVRTIRHPTRVKDPITKKCARDGGEETLTSFFLEGLWVGTSDNENTASLPNNRYSLPALNKLASIGVVPREVVG